MNDESPSWGAWLMAALMLICCGGPLLVAAVGAGGLSLVAAWLQPYRVALLTAAGVLFAVGVYLNRRRSRRRLTSTCRRRSSPCR